MLENMFLLFLGQDSTFIFDTLGIRTLVRPVVNGRPPKVTGGPLEGGPLGSTEASSRAQILARDTASSPLTSPPGPPSYACLGNNAARIPKLVWGRRIIEWTIQMQLQF